MVGGLFPNDGKPDIIGLEKLQLASNLLDA
jgi:hypothetical protein